MELKQIASFTYRDGNTLIIYLTQGTGDKKYAVYLYTDYYDYDTGYTEKDLMLMERYRRLEDCMVWITEWIKHYNIIG